MIEVRSLTKNYGERSAIRNLNFTIKKGEVVGFLGPNGAGKSTTMKIITGYMAPSEGTVKVAGIDVFEDPIAVKKRIGYLPETPPVYSDMYVDEYLRFVAELKGVESAQINSKIASAIEKTNIGDVRRRLIGHLSKGFRQRVGLAQALVSDPDILILDEPTVGLDPKQMSEIRHLILQLRGLHTIVLSTHILPEVQATCEKVLIINQGQIVAEDSLQGLARRMSGGGQMVKLRVMRQQEAIVQGISSLAGVRKVHVFEGAIEVETDVQDQIIEKVAEFVVSKGAGLIELKTEALALEEIFIKLTSSTETHNQEGLN